MRNWVTSQLIRSLLPVTAVGLPTFQRRAPSTVDLIGGISQRMPWLAATGMPACVASGAAACAVSTRPAQVGSNGTNSAGVVAEPALLPGNGTLSRLPSV